ncbi:MAG: hypothetical protein IJD21_06655 [Oscillospiraceae bacterium]|nr:hypothetical protein [Oscillospiraceae bacterium]
MSKKQILGGLGAGIAVGAVLSLAMSPKSRMSKRASAGRAMKTVSQVMDQIADALVR